MQNIPGRTTRSISHKLDSNGNLNVNKEEPITIVFVVPKNIISAYKEELIGIIKDGKIQSGPGLCTIYSEEDNKHYRQYYTSMENIEHLNKIINEINNINLRIEILSEIKKQIFDIEGTEDIDITDINDVLKYGLKDLTIDSYNTYITYINEIRICDDLLIKNNNEIIQLKEDLESEKERKKIFESKMESKIKEVYFIVSQETFINRLSQDVSTDENLYVKKEKEYNDDEGGYENENEEEEYEDEDKEIQEQIKQRYDKKGIKKLQGSRQFQASSYLMSIDNIWKPSEEGVSIGNPPFSDIFQSQKSLIIIDEIQKGVSEKGINHHKLWSALYIYARNVSDKNYACKICLFTATPVYDKITQPMYMCNLLRPRAPFPKNSKELEEMFINNDERVIKNKLLLKYMFSGYISYFKGGHPNNYPYRRNHTILHDLSDIQLRDYVNALADDLKKAKTDKTVDYLEKVILGISAETKGSFIKSSGICISALPTSLQTTKLRSPDYANALLLLNEFKKNKRDLSYYSTKLKYIANKIIESSNTNEGPIFVFCSRIARGLLPLIYYLETKGFSVLTEHEVSNDPKNPQINKSGRKIGIWTGELMKELSRDKSRKIGMNYTQYLNNLKKLFNSSENSDGKICKVIFANVIEGVSFMNISQIHVCNPWWNESKMEQVIARGIRFNSHITLTENKRFVDVYYHCSIFNKQPFGIYTNDVHAPKSTIEDLLRSKDVDEKSIKNFSSNSVEQIMFIVAKNKNEINIQFEKILKESSYDAELNKFGNIIRFEEITLKGMKFFYNRVDNTYYILKNQDLTRYMESIVLEEIELIYGSDDENTWPFTDYIQTNKIITCDTFSIIQDIHGKSMISLLIYEKIDSFIADEEFNKYNFYELKKVAIEKYKEDIKVWNVIEDNINKEEYMKLVFKIYDIKNKESGKKLYSDLINGLYNASKKCSKVDIEKYLFTEEAIRQKEQLLKNSDFPPHVYKMSPYELINYINNVKR